MNDNVLYSVQYKFLAMARKYRLIHPYRCKKERKENRKSLAHPYSGQNLNLDIYNDSVYKDHCHLKHSALTRFIVFRLLKAGREIFRSMFISSFPPALQKDDHLYSLWEWTESDLLFWLHRMHSKYCIQSKSVYAKGSF